jgi:hypothetical protein
MLWLTLLKWAKFLIKKPYDFYHTETVQNFIKAFCGNDNLRFQNEFTAKGKLIKVKYAGYTRKF